MLLDRPSYSGAPGPHHVASLDKQPLHPRSLPYHQGPLSTVRGRAQVVSITVAW